MQEIIDHHTDPWGIKVTAVEIKDVELPDEMRRAIARQARRDRRGFEKAQLIFREAESFDAWWSAVRAAAEGMHLSRVVITVPNRDGSGRLLIWRHPRLRLGTHERIRLAVPIRDRRRNAFLHSELDVPVNGSLEAAGRRAQLFTRLLEEHGLENLPKSQPNSIRAA